jgi:hypothetical protein
VDHFPDTEQEILRWRWWVLTVGMGALAQFLQHRGHGQHGPNGITVRTDVGRHEKALVSIYG